MTGDADAPAKRAGAAAPWREGWRAAAWLTLLALSLRLLALRVENVITPDGVGYATLAGRILEGNFSAGLHAYWPPLYPLLIAAVGLLAPDAEAAGRLVSTVAGALTVVPVYYLARDFYGARVALLAALLTALHPLLVYYSTMVLTEATYTLLLVCGVLAGWRALVAWRARDFALAGLAFGACYLLKPEAAGYVLLLAAMALVAKLFDSSKSPRELLQNAGALAAGWALLAAPYLLYLRFELGHWTPSGKMAGHLLRGRDTRLGALAAPDSVSWLMQLTKALRYEYELLNLIFPLPFVALAAVGLFRSPWARRRAAREAYLCAFMLAALAGYAVTVANIRFLVPLAPLALVWVAKGIDETEAWARESLGDNRRGSRATRWLKPVLIAVLILSLLPLFAYLLRGDKWADYGAQKRAGLWIAARHAGQQTQHETPPLVMATVPVAPFYAHARHAQLARTDTVEQVLARLHSEGVNYLVLSERDLRDTPLRPLLDKSSSHPGLRLVFKQVERPDRRVLVYEPDNPTTKP